VRVVLGIIVHLSSVVFLLFLRVNTSVGDIAGYFCIAFTVVGDSLEKGGTSAPLLKR